MKNFLISVIVPVYNVEDYLPKCLNSIIEQTYENLEIILIDDGSIDDSGRICDEYKVKDNRIIVLHKNNAGVSTARNNGIELANGEYVCFIDSDDWIEKNYFELAANVLNNYNPDCLINNFVRDDGTGKIKKMFFNSTEQLVMDKDVALIEMFNRNNFGWEPFATFYKSNLLKNVKFNQDIHFGEDLLFKYTFIKECKGNIVYFPMDKYHYVFRSTSAVNSYSIKKRVDDLMVARFIMSKEDNEIGRVFFNKCYCALLVDKCRVAAFDTSDSDEELVCEIKKEIRSIISRLIWSNDIHYIVKLKMIVGLCPSFIIRIAYGIFKFLKEVS